MLSINALLEAALSGDVSAKNTLFEGACDRGTLNNKQHCDKWGHGLCIWQTSLRVLTFYGSEEYRKDGFKYHTDNWKGVILDLASEVVEDFAVEWFNYITSKDLAPFESDGDDFEAYGVSEFLNPSLLKKLVQAVITLKPWTVNRTHPWQFSYYKVLFGALLDSNCADTLDEYLWGIPFFELWSCVIKPEWCTGPLFEHPKNHLSNQTFQQLLTVRFPAVKAVLFHHLMRLWGPTYFTALVSTAKGRALFSDITVGMELDEFILAYRVTGIPLAFSDFSQALKSLSEPILDYLVGKGFPGEIKSRQSVVDIVEIIIENYFCTEPTSYRIILSRLRQSGWDRLVTSMLVEAKENYERKAAQYKISQADKLKWLAQLA